MSGKPTFPSAANGRSTRSKRPRSFASFLGSDKGLLSVFVGSAVIVSLSFIFVQFRLEDPTDFGSSHGLEVQLGQQSASALAAASAAAAASTSQFQVKKSVTDSGPKVVPTRDDQEESSLVDVRGHGKEGGHGDVVDVITTIKISDEKSEENDESFLTHSSPYHTIFSTGCSIYQDWQSYIFFYHVNRTGQEGHVTRIVSGCDSAEEVKLQEVFSYEIESMNPGNHHLHFTPDYSRVPKVESRPYKYFNKPFGVRHWMEHALGYPENHELHDDSIIILMDPDQIMLRPFTNDFTHSSEIWKLHKSKRKKILKVEHGSPYSQQYGYGIQWFNGGRSKDKIDPEYVFQDGRLPTPISNLTSEEVRLYYAAMGPPYIATAKDMWQIACTWSDIAPKVHDKYPNLLAEMFAYNFAIAHLGLRHTVAFSFMVSDVWSGGEGWPLIDKVNETNICTNYPKSELPHVIHYCQRYYLGSDTSDEWFFFGKHKLPKNFISCESPLLKRPPDDFANYTKYSKGKVPDGELKEWRPKQAKEEAFMLCELIRAVNDAAVYYKDQHCKDGTANYEYSHDFFK
eukprot:CAMPEP_0172387108 /NCGR_PEP_ID=MMETSP1061-20121228/4502_1 /TAXON_ID=37318 /ORGANISM="Pseudo-nitzschia pungens, Strain cf. pungens" /LENGTH=568 /DNA_ID=CAMNT_0013116677 /DNA_START=57 /DNA_END=1763 /DNA_ORIENTATION=+